MAAPVKLIGIFTARPGKAEELRALLDGMVTKSRQEPGNLRYDLWEDQAESGLFVTDELYVDNRAITAHHETPHYRNYLARINDLAERTALMLNPIGVA